MLTVRAHALVLATVLSASSLLAQGGGQLEALPRALDDGAGLQRLDGQLVGVGRDYKVYFRAGEVEFVPALGSAAPRNLPLALRTIAVGRGEELRPLTEVAATPDLDALRVRYEHGLCTERYELRSAGMAQSFEFSALPAGHGDLVVRCRVATELPRAAPLPGESARFCASGIGGVAIGGVTGVAADGAAIAGSAHLDDDVLELRLPAAFVEAAALPLVLDPIVASVTIDQGSSGRIAPDVAFVSDAFGTGRFLVAYQMILSGSDSDVLAREVDADTRAVSATRIIAATNGVIEQQPAVGGIDEDGGFVVAYIHVNIPDGEIRVRGVTSAGGVTSAIPLSPSGQNCAAPAVGGTSRSGYPNAVVVWTNTDFDRVQGRAVAFGTSGPFTVLVQGPQRTLAFASGDPVVGDISRTGGRFGRWLLTYHVRIFTNGPRVVRAIVVDNALNVLDVAAVLSSAAGFDYSDSSVDGDGARWLVGFESSASTSAQNDIRCLTLKWDSSTGTLFVPSSSQAVATSSRNEVFPAVVTTGHTSLVGWSETNTANDLGSQLSSRENHFGFVCEGSVTVVDTIGRDELEPRGAATFEVSGHPGERALLAVSRQSGSGFTGGIWGYFWENTDGEQSTLDVPCPNGGRIAAPCAMVGNNLFRITLHDAPLNTNTFLVVSPARLNLGCGLCSVLADPFQGFVLMDLVGSIGEGSRVFSVPPANALRGVEFFAQWLTPVATAGCTQFGAPFLTSDMVHVRIQ